MQSPVWSAATMATKKTITKRSRSWATRLIGGIALIARPRIVQFIATRNRMTLAITSAISRRRFAPKSSASGSSPR